MSDAQVSPPALQPLATPKRRMIAWGLLRALGSTVALVAIYYLLPLDHSSTPLAATILIIGLVVFGVLLGFQVRWILRSPFPGIRAAEVLATSVPFFLLLFAATYAVLGHISAGDFSQSMSHTNALYFSVTVFSTVGFGDITAKTQMTRLLVTAQMILDLAVIGLGVRLILGAVTRSQQRRSAEAEARRPND